MAGNESWKKDEEDDEDDFDETNYLSQKDAILFAIDISKSMLTTPPPSGNQKADTDSPAVAAIKCAYQIMQQRIISSPKDMMGILLFGTETSKFQDEESSSRGSIQYPHCYLLSDLNVPDIDDIRTLKAIVEDSSGARDVLKPSTRSVSMSNVLFCANQIFATRAPNFGSRRLFIISDNDDPHATDKTLRNQAEVRAKDLYDLGVVIELFPISHPGHDFKRTKFYDDIIYRDTSEGSDLVLSPTDFKSQDAGMSLLSSLLSDINSKQVAKRALFSNLAFEIGKGLHISVKGYNLLQKQAPARSCYIWTDAETPQIAEGQTRKFEEGTIRDVDKVEIKRAYTFGGTKVMFSPEEQKQLKDFGSPVLRIIGFKPRSLLKIEHSVKKSTFIYPSEEGFVGSTRVFSSLWKKLLQDKIMAVAWYVARANASPLLVAIIPSQERLDENRKQIVPAGLWLYPVPFADDVREQPLVPPPLRASDDLTGIMRKVVQQLQLPGGIYDPVKFPNPSLQWHYKIIQAMALEEEIPTIPEDKTMPKFRQIHKRAGQIINEWGQVLDEEARASQKDRYGGIDGTDLKRGSGDDHDAGGPPPKKIKAEKTNEREQALADITIDNLKKMIENGGLKKCVLADLKDFLKVKGMSSTGKKQDLIDRIEQWAEDN